MLKCLWGNENRRVYQIRINTQTHTLTNQIRKHVVHIFFRSVFSSTRRPKHMLKLSFQHRFAPSNLEHLSTHREERMHSAHDDAHISEMRSNAMVRYHFNQCAYMYRTRCDTCSFATSACPNVWLLIDLFGWFCSFCFALFDFLHKAGRFSGKNANEKKKKQRYGKGKEVDLFSKHLICIRQSFAFKENTS